MIVMSPIEQASKSLLADRREVRMADVSKMWLGSDTHWGRTEISSLVR
jgi:hypothetical protein